MTGLCGETIPGSVFSAAFISHSGSEWLLKFQAVRSFFIYKSFSWDDYKDRALYAVQVADAQVRESALMIEESLRLIESAKQRIDAPQAIRRL